jgi:hypothetical protein
MKKGLYESPESELLEVETQCRMLDTQYQLDGAVEDEYDDDL